MQLILHLGQLHNTLNPQCNFGNQLFVVGNSIHYTTAAELYCGQVGHGCRYIHIEFCGCAVSNRRFAVVQCATRFVFNFNTGPVLKFEHFLGLFCRIRVLEKLVGKAMAIEIGIFYAVQLSTQCLALLLASYEFRSDAASV